MANIRKFLDLSTAHLKLETLKFLNEANMGHDVRWVCYPTEYGWFMYVGEEPDNMPDEIRAAFQKARDLGCEYILYDADAEPQDFLPIFEH